MAAPDSFPGAALEVTLDGMPVEIPPERRAFAAIRSHLEFLALQQQRILCSLNVDGESIHLTQPRPVSKPFSLVEAETMSLGEVPMQLIRAALQQTSSLQKKVHSAVERVLINPPRQARELWWTLSTALKEPLLTLSLLPDHTCKPVNGSASLTQLRKWQLQQLGCILQEVEEASRMDDTMVLSESLEKRLLPWLDKLAESLTLWHETIAGQPRASWQKA